MEMAGLATAIRADRAKNKLGMHTMKTTTFLAILMLTLSASANAKGVIKTGGMIGPHPQTFSDRFNGMKSDIPGLFPRISITTGKINQTQNLGNGVTLTAKLVSAADAFETVGMTCNTQTSTKRITACMLGMYYAATALDTSINQTRFMDNIKAATNTGFSIYNQNGIDYAITVNRKKKSVAMIAKSDTPMQIEQMEDIDEEHMKSSKCNPMVELCIKAK